MPMLASARPEEYGPILVTWHENADAQLHVLERARLGVTHDELGGHLGAFWELPDSLTSTIGNHHRSEATDWELPPALKLVSLHRETEVVSHDSDRTITRQRSQRLHRIQPLSWIETCGRLIGQQHRRLHRERPREFDPTPLTAGE